MLLRAHPGPIGHKTKPTKPNQTSPIRGFKWNQSGPDPSHRDLPNGGPDIVNVGVPRSSASPVYWRRIRISQQYCSAGPLSVRALAATCLRVVLASPIEFAVVSARGHETAKPEWGGHRGGHRGGVGQRRLMLYGSETDCKQRPMSGPGGGSPQDYLLAGGLGAGAFRQG